MRKDEDTYVGFLNEKECAICGKHFIAREEYIYKLEPKNRKKGDRIQYYCGWNHYRQAKREILGRQNIDEPYLKSESAYLRDF